MVRQPTEILRETNHQSFIKHVSSKTDYRLEAILEKIVVTITSPRAANITLRYGFNCFHHYTVIFISL